MHTMYISSVCYTLGNLTRYAVRSELSGEENYTLLNGGAAGEAEQSKSSSAPSENNLLVKGRCEVCMVELWLFPQG